MMAQGNGTGPLTVHVSRERDFAVFDTLPPQVRQAMNEAMFSRVAAEVAIMVRQLGPDKVAALMPLADRRVLEKEAASGR